MTTLDTPAASADQVEELAGRLFMAGVGAAELHTVHLGQRLGIYAALDGGGPQTLDEIVASTGLDRRYVREWLQSQAISALLTLDGDLDTGRFALAPGITETLVDETHPAYVGAIPGVFPIIGEVSGDLLEAFRTGSTVPYTRYGPDAVTVQAAMNRPAFQHQLAGEWLPQIPDVLQRLQDADDPATVADVCCGVGWSSVALASAFPHITLWGFDNDETSIAQARRHAAEAGVADRVRFEVCDVADDSGTAELYDAMFIFEAVHDLPHPVEALIACRHTLKRGASLIVMDENAAPEPTYPGNEVERFLAAASTLWCTPQGHGPGSEVVGAIMRPDTMADIARRAGFASSEVLPIEHPFFRFYRLQN